MVAYRHYPNNDSTNVGTYGYLYNWKAVMNGSDSSNTNPSGVQGICPLGWHVPSHSEWAQLRTYVGNQSQYTCEWPPLGWNDNPKIAKSLADSTSWNYYNTDCTVGNNISTNNATGFSAVPAGRYAGGYLNMFGNIADFWTTTASDDTHSYYYTLVHNSAILNWLPQTKDVGFSVRCIRD